MNIRTGLALSSGSLLLILSGGVSAQTPQTMPANRVEARKAMLAARAARLSKKVPSTSEIGVAPNGTGGTPGPGRYAETVLFSFDNVYPQGSSPSTGVIRDSAGNLYGTAFEGGNTPCACGVVFRIDKAGNIAVLHTFTGGTDGGYPDGGLILDKAGNLYGTTSLGGSGSGVVFKLDQTGSETVLYTFTHWASGIYPLGSLLMDKAGNLYGAAYGGRGGGVIFKLDQSGNETVLYAFTGRADGEDPTGSLIMDNAGNLYGTTEDGGSSSFGVVFKLDSSGNETVLYTFTGADGEYPNGSLVRDDAGNLYGTTIGGGKYFGGAVFKLDSSGNERVLYSFTGVPDGDYPWAGVVRDQAGNLFGTTQHGGGQNDGIVFKINTSGGETVLHSFTYSVDGGGAAGSLILDAAGNLYGTAPIGGPLGSGTVYEIERSGKEIVYPLPGSAGGSTPFEAVALDSSGNLYGSTSRGGADGYGVVFKVDPFGDETVLHAFRGGADGSIPNAVILDSAGNIYGSTESYHSPDGGAAVVFKLDASGNETLLHTFTGADGAGQYSGALVRDAAGDLFGTTALGGNLSDCNPYGCGVVFKLDPYGNETVLYTFTGAADGGGPNGGLIRDSAGNLYGTTAGLVFKVDPSGNETVLYSFTGGADGGFPWGGLVRDSAGHLYGTTLEGGTSNWGVVFKLGPSGKETVLHSFTGGADGGFPAAGLVRDPAGNLYGTTVGGGPANCGVVFKLDTSGNLTVLHTFTCGADGGNPEAGMIFDPEGYLYGTAATGGEHDGGVIFRILPPN